MLFANVAVNYLGPALRAAGVRPHVVGYLGSAGRPRAPRCGALEVPVPQLVRVQLGTLPRQVGDLQVRPLRRPPNLDDFRAVHGVPVHDEEYLPLRLRDQPRQQGEEHRHPESP